ncbi:MAG: ABC transporter permease [Planctomycetota bacterium]
MTHIQIDASQGSWVARVGEALARRELLWILVRRDLAVRYREALLGVAWAVLVPVATLGVYWFVFDVIFERRRSDVPYVLFLFPAMLVWGYFNSSVGRAAQSLIRDASLLSKVYFPRLLLPVSNVLSPLVDAAIGLVALLVIFALYRHAPGAELVWFPFFLLMAIAAATGVGTLMAAWNSRFKDVQHFLPVMLHLWFFSSPVLYSTTFVSERFRLFYALNPMVTVCEGVRFAVLGSELAVTPAMIAIGVGSTLVLLAAGLASFLRTEQTITDVL